MENGPGPPDAPRTGGDAAAGGGLVVPLGIPLLAGPGAITTVMIYMTAPVSDSTDKMFVFAGILVAVLSALVFLHNADRIFRKIGRTGTRAFVRHMDFLIEAIGVHSVVVSIF